jgi:hypothetical protein
MPELVLKFGETVYLKDADGRVAATIQLTDEGKRGVFLVVKPNDAAIPTTFRCWK